MSDPPRPQRILVVDDEEDVQILVGRILKDVGFEVDQAADGAEAIDKIGQARPDLVVLDLMMPGVDGWGVLDHLRGLAGAPPVVVLTARGEYATFARSVREGATAFVFKPFRFQELVATCQRVLLAGGRPQEPIGRERRQHRRQVLMAEVNVLSRDSRPIALGELVNLSRGGAQVDLAAPLDPGTRVRLALHVPDARTPRTLTGEVCWRVRIENGFSHGLTFIGLNREDERNLADLLRTED